MLCWIISQLTQIQIPTERCRIAWIPILHNFHEYTVQSLRKSTNIHLFPHIGLFPRLFLFCFLDLRRIIKLILYLIVKWLNARVCYYYFYHFQFTKTLLVPLVKNWQWQRDLMIQDIKEFILALLKLYICSLQSPPCFFFIHSFWICVNMELPSIKLRAIYCYHENFQ